MIDNQSLLAFCRMTSLSIPLQTIVLKFCLPMLPMVTVQAAGSGTIIARAVSRADMDEQLQKQDLFLDGWPSCVLFADVGLQKSVSPEEVWTSPERFPQLFGGINLPLFTGNFVRASLPSGNYDITGWCPDDPNMYIATNNGTNRVFQSVPSDIRCPSRPLQRTKWNISYNHDEKNYQHVHPEYGTFVRSVEWSAHNKYSPNGRYSVTTNDVIYDFRTQQHMQLPDPASGSLYFWIRNHFIGQRRSMDENGDGVLFVWTIQGKLVQTIPLGGNPYRTILLNEDHTKFAFCNRIYY